MDKKQCRYTDENGQVQNPSLNACAEAVSAVKAIQIAASQGQKVYTVNASNASAALAASGAGGEIKEAIQAGMEVTFHERSINAHGWSGTGYSIVDPETGVGSYLIEGKGNGGIAFAFGVHLGVVLSLAFITLMGAVTAGPVGLAALAVIMLTLFPIIAVYIGNIKSFIMSGSRSDQIEKLKCFVGGIGYGLTLVGGAVALASKSSLAKAVGNKAVGIIMAGTGLSLATIGGGDPISCFTGVDVYDWVIPK